MSALFGVGGHGTAGARRHAMLMLLGCTAALPLAPLHPPDGIYVLSVPSFQDSDADGLGDLQGVRWHLQHLRSLGVRTVQLLPLEPSDQTAGSVPSATGLDPALGTGEDLAALVADLHQFDMRLEVRVPMQAIGDEHPWYTAALAGAGRLHLGDIAGEGWYPTGDGRDYYATGGVGLPDLDWTDPGLAGDRAESLAWLAAVDGVVLEPLGRVGPDAVQIAEALAAELALRGVVVSATAAPEPVVSTLLPWTALGDVEDLPGWLALQAAVADGDARWSAHTFAAWDGAPTRTLLGGPSERRLGSWVPDEALRRTILALTMLGPGVPQLWYGVELDMADATTNPVDEPWLAPMAWDNGPTCGFTEGEPWYTPDPACKVGQNAYDQARDPNSTLSFVRRLADVRSAWGRADRVIEGVPSPVLVMCSHALCVLGNFSGAPVAVALPEVVGEDAQGRSVIGELTLEAYGHTYVKRLGAATR